MIRSFLHRETEKLWQRQPVKRIPPDIQRLAYRKLVMLDAAIRLEELTRPPGNRLEALSGDRKGQYSIRINQQWRICFVWREHDAWQVEIVDYH